VEEPVEEKVIEKTSNEMSLKKTQSMQEESNASLL